ncbi:MAG: flavodoxin family protein [Bacteroidales bacterium]|jgi:NAD(P)H-dependent FMN reductase|nr:flavodoxin family protein [Bacteroidales bacterium]
MKILILNGSAHRNGSVSKMLKEIRNNIPESNSVEEINVYDLHFAPCTGCMKCRSTGTCCMQHDDAHNFAEKIKDADALVIGSPTYWGNMNGYLKMLFDRIVPVLMGESKKGLPIPMQKGKKAAIAISCTTPFPFNIIAGQTTKNKRALKEILKYSGYKTVGTMVMPGTKMHNDISDRLGKKAKKIAKRISKN